MPRAFLMVYGQATCLQQQQQKTEKQFYYVVLELIINMNKIGFFCNYIFMSIVIGFFG